MKFTLNLNKKEFNMSKTVSKVALVAGVVLAMVFAFSCSSDDDGGGGSSSSEGTQGGVSSSSVSSSSSLGGGNTCSADFRTVAIGTQTWMAENLNCDVGGSKCYDNDPANCDKYGRLYDWSTAMDFASNCNSSSCSSQIQTKHRGICPSGWHIPSDAEWTTLTDYVGSSTAGTELKAVSGWYSNSGTDSYGFSALPGGACYSSGDFGNVGYFGEWWSATEYDASITYLRRMDYDLSDVGRGYGNKSPMFSVRCVKD